jgi:membrane-bound ClpP family serine protease
MEALAEMGANRQQGWSLLLFLVGFTFLVAGLFALGPVVSIGGVACLIASVMWCYRIKPLEHQGTEGLSYQGAEKGPAEAANIPPKKRQAI